MYWQVFRWTAGDHGIFDLRMQCLKPRIWADRVHVVLWLGRQRVRGQLVSDLVWLIKIDVGFVTLGILKWELHYHILRQLRGGGGGGIRIVSKRQMDSRCHIFKKKSSAATRLLCRLEVSPSRTGPAPAAAHRYVSEPEARQLTISRVAGGRCQWRTGIPVCSGCSAPFLFRRKKR